jgi:hypothetical protein
MQSIWKYPVEPNSIRRAHQPIDLLMPVGAKPLCVMEQADAVCIWAEVDTEVTEKELVRFACVGTGHGAVPPKSTYFGSVVNGPYVWHFYRLA